MRNKGLPTIRLAGLLVGISLGGPVGLVGLVELLHSPSAFSEDFSGEDQDRRVDKAALISQKDAEATLTEMLNTPVTDPDKSNLLARLADVQQESAAMQFRVAHGEALRKGKPLKLDSYKKVMLRSIPTLSRLIREYPQYSEIAHAYFMRAKAYEETDQTKLSTQDYLYYVKTFPKNSETVSAYLSLAEFAMAGRNFSLATQYLKPIENDPSDPHYPIILSKTAWAYYNLHNFTASLNYSEKLISFFKTQSQSRKLESSEQAILENTLEYVPIFIYENHQAKRGNAIKSLSTEQVFAYMKNLDQGADFGKMVMSYAKLLRANDDEKELNAWKNVVLKTEAARPESAELILLVYEYQLNKGHFSDIVVSAQDLVSTLKKQKDLSQASEAQKLLLETANSLQKLILKNKDSKNVDAVTDQLAAIYGVFSDLVGENDPRVIRAHRNLGETYFSVKSYEKSANQYRWLVGKGNLKNAPFADASLKSISSRYEALRQQHLAGNLLQAAPLPKADRDSLDPKLSEWVEWIDTHVAKTGDPIDNFQFEANRALYAQGQPNRALKRLTRFALENPKSPSAVAAATLVIDTEIASQRWTELNAMAIQFAEVNAWQSTDFSEHMHKIAADASYKNIEALVAEKNYRGAIAQVQDFSRHYKNSEHYVDSLILAGNASVALKERSQAISYYQSIAAAQPKSKTAALALLASAHMEEAQYEFASAADYYEAYLSLGEKSAQLESLKTGLKTSLKTSLKTRVIDLVWLSGQTSKISSLLSNRHYCDREHEKQCDGYRVLFAFSKNSGQSYSLPTLIKNATNARPELKSLWAALALDHARALNWQTRHEMINQLVNYWKNLDSLGRLTLASRISNSVHASFAFDREEIRRSSAGGHLKLTGPTLAKRVKLIREMEDTAALANHLPWIRLRSLVLNEVAGVYSDLSSDIKAIAPARKLTLVEWRSYSRSLDKMVNPFDQKANGIRRAALKLAAQAQGSPDENPLNLQFLQAIDKQGAWKTNQPGDKDPAQNLRSHWAEAIENKNWAQMSFFLREAKTKSLLPSDIVGVAQAVTLATAGAQAEANITLRDHGRI